MSLGYNALDWSELKNRLKERATSHFAAECLADLQPRKTVAEAKESFRDIKEFQEVLSGGERPFMESLDLFSPWIQRLEKNAVLKTMELKDVRFFCVETISLQEVLKNFESDYIVSFKEDLFAAESVLSAIEHIMTPEGEIRSDASEKLYSLNREKKQLGRQLERQLDKLVKDNEMEGVLQDRFVTNKEGRWVIPVKSGMRHELPGIIHGHSQTKQTVYMEPQEVVPVNNRLREIEVDIQEEIDKLLRQLSEFLQTHVDDFHQSYKALLKADILFAQAQFCQQIGAIPCEFSENEIELKEVKHPLLILNNDSVVANSVQLNSEKNILLLSGPNAGGKTVLLKSIGLAAQMARCGLPICASEGSKIVFFAKLYIGVGDEQSVDERLSTFAAHLKVLNNSLEAKGTDQLILIDEICGSTDPEEGSALARSFIEKYSENRAFAIITSHLGPLKSHWSPESGVINGSLEYDEKTGKPTYQFISGIPGRSQALQTAKRVGVSENVIERAFALLSPESQKFFASQNEAEEMKKELNRQIRALRHQETAAREKERKYKELLANFEKEKATALQDTVKEAEKKVDQMIQNAKVDKIFRSHENLQKIKTDFPKIVKAPSSQIDSPEEFAKRYPPGSTVFIPGIGQDGLIQSEPNSKGLVTVQSQSMRLQVAWQDLKAAKSPNNPTKDIARRSSKFDLSLTDGDRVVDLRGQTVEEALENLEVQLDTAMKHDEDRMKIVHGHGTEALKRAVRAHLSRSLYVQSWAAGNKQNGGDGVTWVDLAH